MINRLISHFNNLGIRIKLFIVFLAVITVPFCLFLLINYTFSYRAAEKQALYTAEQILFQAKSYLDYKTEFVKNTLIFVTLNDTVIEIANKDSASYETDIGMWIADSNKLDKVFYTSNINPDIHMLQLYMSNGLASLTQTEKYLSLTSVENTDWYKKMLAGNEIVNWFPDKYFDKNTNQNYIYATRWIKDDVGNFVGIAKLDILETNIKIILDRSYYIESSSVFLINSNNDIISTSNDSKINDSNSITDLFSITSVNDLYPGTWTSVNYNNEKQLIGVQNINNSDWKLYFVIPYSKLMETTMKINKQIILAFLLIAPLTFPLAYFVSASSTNRIRKLRSNMKYIVNGDFNISIIPGSDDEIGELIKTFNYMSTKISMLLDDKVKLGKEIKNKELLALQAQINPHFLYNTLDIINGMSIIANSSQITHTIELLSDYYRLSLSKGKDTVTIKDEITHGLTYVKINVPEYLLQYKILKIVLQPIIENSIIHGIMEKESEAGTIIISGKIEDNAVILSVADDGVGIPEEKLQEILTITDTKDSHGYGIKNIHERLQINYGNQYGLTFKSKLGKGTTVEIKLPILYPNIN